MTSGRRLYIDVDELGERTVEALEAAELIAKPKSRREPGAPIRYDIIGDPQPQGSKTPVVRNGRAVLLDGRRGEARAKFKAWRAAVAEASADYPAMLDEPAMVVLSFRLPKPKSLPAWRWLQWARFDIDKLSRAVLDGMTDGGTLQDDGRVAALLAFKRFAIDEEPGCSVTVIPLGRVERDAPISEPVYVQPWPGVPAA